MRLRQSFLVSISMLAVFTAACSNEQSTETQQETIDENSVQVDSSDIIDLTESEGTASNALASSKEITSWNSDLLRRTKACRVHYDTILNQKRDGSEYVVSTEFSLTGWSYIGENSEQAYVSPMVGVFSSEGGESIEVVSLDPRVREDVASYFGNDDLQDAGFELKIDASILSGGYTFNIGWIDADTLSICSHSGTLQLTIG